MTREVISSDKAPAAIGVYSQAVKVNNMVYISGQIPLVPATGELLTGDIKIQIRRVFDNLDAIAKAAGGDLNSAVKFNVFLIDLAHFASVNEVMEEFLQAPFPARAAVQVAALPKGAEVEVDAILAL